MELIVQQEAGPFGEGKNCSAIGNNAPGGGRWAYSHEEAFVGVSEPAKMSGLFHAIGCALASLPSSKGRSRIAPRIWERLSLDSPCL
jgi:hypothetical protein